LCLLYKGAIPRLACNQKFPENCKKFETSTAGIRSLSPFVSLSLSLPRLPLSLSQF